ncbi:MAG: hypothetical protein Ct9H300mP11_05810 [Chloroflexota bacterium]|nr:MAG: hypothetical protein Ct9H300mP11_05810 [Chloroflexota bacterium]
MPFLTLNGSRFHYHWDDYTEPWRSKSGVSAPPRRGRQSSSLAGLGADDGPAL